MNPMLAKYNSLVTSGRNITKMDWQHVDNIVKVKPTGLIFTFNDGTQESLDISELSHDEFRKYESQLRVVWSFLFNN